MPTRIFTIGYEGATQDQFIATLQQAGVVQVIDVRAVPLSRKPGFSKNVLAAGLKAAGIAYVHLKALGTPPEGREAARKGNLPGWSASMPGSSTCRRRRFRRRRCWSLPPTAPARCSASSATPACATAVCC